MAVGAAGGLVPSPSALVVLLGAIALGLTWFGIALVLGYGLGMALCLVGAGFLLVRARSSLDGRLAAGRLARAGRVLPVVCASLVVVAGLGLSLRAFTQIV
jgi:nickel/cobalt transporter (NicO) family protein